jgi:CPA2 family monovalent cation:H+ antiporter-2
MSMAMVMGVMPEATGHFMLIVVALSMLVTPGLAVAGQRVAAWMEHREPPHALAPTTETLPDLGEHVIIAGFGRVGRSVAALLEEEGVPYVALDRDPVLVARHRARDEPVYFGDGRQRAVLSRLGADRARAIVLTLDEETAAEQSIRQIRAHWPEVPIYARARDLAHARVLERAGATRTVPELVESSLQMGAVLLGGLGVPSDAVAVLVERVRDSGYEGL